jgi:hypothetical protein
VKGLSYKEFRESNAAFYDTPEGRLSRSEIIKKLESFIVQRLGDGKDFFKKNQITEIKQA